MDAVVVEYARFVEAQQRRARLVEELRPANAAETNETKNTSPSCDAAVSREPIPAPGGRDGG